MKTRVIKKNILFIVLIFYGSESISQELSLNNLKSGLNPWEVLENQKEDDYGHIRLHQSKWLMCFLHWRSITEKNKELTIEYVRNQLLTFWGPNMAYFSLTGEEGKTKINGHNAYYVSGNFRNEVSTKFIIWNCQESNRQFIADININKQLNTPDVYLDIQEVIAKSTCCHGNCNTKGGTILHGYFENTDYGVAFNKPAKWRTAAFEPEVWYPEGARYSEGSLWTLLPDAETQIDFFWLKSDDKISIKLITALFEKLQNENGIQFTDLVFNQFTEKNCKLRFKGNYKMINNAHYKEKYIGFSDNYLFHGEAWKENGTIFFLLVSIINVDNMWGIEVDLTPTDEIFEQILKNAYRIFDLSKANT